MSSWKTFLVVAFLLRAFSAVAADMQPPAIDTPPINPPEVNLTESSSGHGWYLRGDLGYNAVLDADTPSYRNFNSTTKTYNNVAFDSFRFGNGFGGTAGIGYKFNEWIRTDISGEYFSSTFSGQSTSGQPCSATDPAGTTCKNAYGASYSALGVMANAYVDLGTVVGITPYVGGGLGVYNVDWGSTRNTATCVNGTSACTITDPSYTYAPADAGWRFAYDFAAGLSYEISPKTHLDIGYRYSHIAGGSALKFSVADTGSGAQGSKAVDNDLTRHEIRAGIRVLLW